LRQSPGIAGEMPFTQPSQHTLPSQNTPVTHPLVRSLPTRVPQEARPGLQALPGSEGWEREGSEGMAPLQGTFASGSAIKLPVVVQGPPHCPPPFESGVGGFELVSTSFALSSLVFARC
jgi:hypothetical protein